MRRLLMGLAAFAGRVARALRRLLGRALATFQKPKWRHGSFGAAVLAGLIVAGVFLNIGVQSLEDAYGWRRDFSFNGYTTTGEQTQQVVSALPSDVQLYLLYQSGQMDSQLYEVLLRYARLSPRIQVLPTDIAKNPGLLTRFQGDLTQALAADNVIVSSEATGRYKILSYDDFVTQGFNVEKGTFEIAGLAYEKSLSEALLYVTQPELPAVGVLQGHGELTMDVLANLTDFWKRNNYAVQAVDLLAGGTLDAVDMLLIAGPQKDLTAGELAAIKAFTEAGGSLFIIRNYTDPMTLPNYLSLLNNYGVTPIPGVVVAGEQDSGSYYGERIYLLPYFTQMEMTQPLISGSMDVLLLAGACAFETPAQTDNALSAATVLKTGANAYVKNPEDGASSIDYAQGDVQGELTLAILAARMHAGGTVSRMFAIGNSTVFTDEYMYQRTFNEEFILQVMGELLPQKSVSLDILAKSAFHPGMRAGSQTVGVILLTALPLLIILAAVLVLTPRRNR
ncbi:MAG: Gldg family protein [Candidatus Limiplasma sp.]|nr:Gldg family protein [Candidatus Limiplasma sp.]MEA5146825.1 Gldg family protein [Candidatus Limiplasma sp.]